MAADLRELDEWRIELHPDYLNRGVPDMDVVALCGQRRWALVTCDDMRYTPETKYAMVAWNVCVFKVVIHKKTHLLEMTSALIAGRKRILDLLDKQPHPFCAHVQLNGTVTVMSSTFNDVKMTDSQRQTFKKYGKVMNL